MNNIIVATRPRPPPSVPPTTASEPVPSIPYPSPCHHNIFTIPTPAPFPSPYIPYPSSFLINIHTLYPTVSPVPTSCYLICMFSNMLSSIRQAMLDMRLDVPGSLRTDVDCSSLARTSRTLCVGHDWPGSLQTYLDCCFYLARHGHSKTTCRS